MQSFTYLFINFFTIIICFVFSFHRKIQFHRHFGAFLRASIIVMIPFVLWDIWFTKTGVWWFNDRYLLGVGVFGLPIEEWLFFICIPFSCVFTYYCLDKFFELKWNTSMEKWLVNISCLICLLMIVCFYTKIYTLVTFSAIALTLLYLYYIAKIRWIGKASFIYMILMFGFVPVNGVLTGTGLEEPIVNYNVQHFLNIRLLTIPIEDIVYGYTLILWNIYFFLKFKKPEVVHG